MDKVQPALLGEYGALIDQGLADRQREYSFLRDSWTDVADWSRKAKELVCRFLPAPENPQAPGSGRGQERSRWRNY